MRCIIHILNQNGSDVMRGKVGTAGTNNSLDAAQCPNKQGNIRHCKFYSQTLLLYVSRWLWTHVTTA